jgi:hypothetical protein
MQDLQACRGVAAGFAKYGVFLALLEPSGRVSHRNITGTLVLVVNSGNVDAAVAGHVQYVHGKVQVTNSTGVTHAIKKGEAVNEGDTLVSALGAYAQIRMEGGGMVVMRPDTRLKIDRFVFDGQEDGSERSVSSVSKGGFRAITGTIGKKSKVNYHITTPATTIGIRGNDSGRHL